MATDTTLVVSSSYFTPGTTLATSSVAFITASQMGDAGFPTLIVSSSYFIPHTSQATSSVGFVTASQVAGVGYATSLVNFQQAVTGSGGGGGNFTLYTFVMSGFYVAGAVRETWSGNSVNTPNPTGHPLIDITVMGSYPPQNSAT